MANQTYQLAAQSRELRGKKMGRLRRSGLVPAVLYGYNVQPTAIQLDAHDFEITYRATGKTALVDLSLDSGRAVRVFVHDVQRDPVTRGVRHVDFLAVNLNEAITAAVPVVLTGIAPAVHNGTGVLLRGVESVQVQARPAELPHEIQVSVEGLADVDQAIHVSDLPTAEGYAILDSPGEVVAKIVMTRVEAEEEAEATQEPAAETGDEAEGGPGAESGAEADDEQS